MLNCREVAFLASHKFDASIPFWQRLKMKLHLIMCKNCTQYQKQLKIMHKIIKKLSPHICENSLSSSYKLPEKSKSRIQNALNQVSK